MQMNPHAEALKPIPEKRSFISRSASYVTGVLERVRILTKTLFHAVGAWVQRFSQSRVDDAYASVRKAEDGWYRSSRIFLGIILSVVGSLGFSLLVINVSSWMIGSGGAQLAIALVALVLAETLLGAWLIGAPGAMVVLRRFWIVLIAELVAFSVLGLLKAAQTATEIIPGI